MNTSNTPTNENLPEDDEQLFDLLVDGELDEARRRELLAGLDNKPGGWRKCALAFLEAQSLKDGFAAMVGRPAPASSPARRARRSWPPPHTGTVLAMVASFMVALYLGSLANRAWRAESPNNLAPVEAIAVTPAPQAPLPGEPRTPETPQRADTPSSPWQMVTLGDAAGSGKSVRIPVVERDNLDESWSRKFPSAVPKEVLEKLRRNGLRVRQHRKLLPFRLKDGRRLVVPVDQLDVQYDKEPAL